MLPGMMIPLGAAEQVGAATITYLQQSTDTANRSAYTFTSQSLGVSDASRKIVAAVCAENSSSVIVNSVTIAGVTATPIVSIQKFYSTAYFYCGLYIASVPTGTSGDITVAFPPSDPQRHCGVASWRLVNLTNVAAYDTASDSSLAGSVDVNVASGGLIVSAALVYSDLTNSWAGVTERFDVEVQSSRAFTGGDHTATATETPRTVTLTSSSSVEAVVAASWV